MNLGFNFRLKQTVFILIEISLLFFTTINVHIRFILDEIVSCPPALRFYFETFEHRYHNVFVHFGFFFGFLRARYQNFTYAPNWVIIIQFYCLGLDLWIVGPQNSVNCIISVCPNICFIGIVIRIFLVIDSQ